MRFFKLASFVFILAIHPAFAANSKADESHPVQATLLANADGIVPGKSFTIGLLLKIKPHWHTYWNNPGDAGAATRLKSKTPGFKFSPIQWPTPMLLREPTFVSYCYEKEVLHMVTVTPPKDLKIGDVIELNAKADWLVCGGETCLPGDASFTLKLTVKKTTTPLNEKLFKHWRTKLPIDRKATPASDSIVKIEQDVTENGTPKATFLVTWQTEKPPTDVFWFPAATDGVDVTKVKVDHRKRSTRISFAPDIYATDEVPDGIVQGVLAFTDAKGRRLSVHAPVRVLKAKCK